MANQEHVNLLKEGVDIWNNWRKAHPSIDPDLDEADLARTDLLKVDLSRARLRRADLRQANLFGSDLSEADLGEADLSSANLFGAFLRRANLTRANLYGAILNRARLEGANLRQVHLRVVDFNGANLTEVDLSEAEIGGTSFGANDLSSVKGLETVIHHAPSTIGIDTLYLSDGKIPEFFLRGCGVPNNLIDYLPSILGSMQPIQYYSCFISYSHHDEDFAKRLFSDLRDVGVRCWFAPQELKGGEKILDKINEAIQIHDKVLLILSESSITNSWVEKEVRVALAKEKRQERTMLFPIRLDDAVIESRSEWVEPLKVRYISDFRNWKSHDSYRKALSRLLRDLTISGAADFNAAEQMDED